MESNRKSQSDILTGHIREGKLFKTPLSTLPLEETSWTKQTLPELLWIGLLQGTYGLRRGVDLSLALAEAATQAKSNTPGLLWFAATSSYAALEENEWRKVCRALENSGNLNDLTQALSTLVHFYPECPYARLFAQTPHQTSSKDHALSGFKDLLESLYSKQERAATLVQATAAYLGLVTQKVALVEGISLGNLEAIKAFPHTNESQKVAASVRAMCNFLIGMTLKEIDSGWANYFWNRGFELEYCEYELPYEL
jgi:hypothetical protein